MIILGQTTTNLDSPEFFSTKRTNVPVIRKVSIAEGDSEYCVCLAQCVPELKVFTDGIGTDELKNDWRSFFIPTVNTFTTTSSTITGTITNVDTGTSYTLADPTHGDLYVGDNFWWFKLSWYLVYANYGFGRYRINVLEVGNTSGETINAFESVVYNLCAYSPQMANKTVRIYTEQSGNLLHGNNYSDLTTSAVSKTIPFAQQTRLPGRFYSVPPEIENHRLVLNGDKRPSYQIKDQLKMKYKLALYLLGDKQINNVVFDELFGSKILITDYNLFNHVNDPRDFHANQYIEVPVIRSNQTYPNSTGTGRRRRTYEFDLDYEYDNIFKTNN